MIIFDADKLHKDPMVSVRIITYNHSNFIDECLTSILNQKTNFDFEIVIGDDVSPDNTRDILEAYQKKYPEQIKLVFNDVNLGSNKNIFNTNNNCSGKYVAWCDGDDYWTSENKLQEQVDLLESRPEISLCFHNVSNVDSDSKPQGDFVNGLTSSKTIKGSILFKIWYVANSSVFFRNHHVNEKSPDFVWNGTHGDLIYYLLLEEIGTIYYMNKNMSTYRIHGESITATAYQGIKHNDLHIQQCRDLQDYFKEHYHHYINLRIEGYSLSNVQHHIREKNRRSALKLWFTLVKKRPAMLFSRFLTNSKIWAKLLISFFK